MERETDCGSDFSTQTASPKGPDAVTGWKHSGIRHGRRQECTRGAVTVRIDQTFTGIVWVMVGVVRGDDFIPFQKSQEADIEAGLRRAELWFESPPAGMKKALSR